MNRSSDQAAWPRRGPAARACRRLPEPGAVRRRRMGPGRRRALRGRAALADCRNGNGLAVRRLTARSRLGHIILVAVSQKAALSREFLLMRADLHCHSTASQLSKLGVQRALGLPECATPPQEVLELGLRAAWTSSRSPTTTRSTASWRSPTTRASSSRSSSPAGFARSRRPCTSCAWASRPSTTLQAISNCVESVAEYLHEHEITCALAHPFYAVEAPLTAAPPPPPRAALPDLGGPQRPRAPRSSTCPPSSTSRRTAAPASAAPTTTPASTSAARGPRRPRAATPAEFLAHIRAGRAAAARRPGQRREVGARRDGAGRPLARTAAAATPTRRTRPPCCGWSSASCARARPARGAIGADLAPDDARALLRAWLDAVELGDLDERRPAGRDAGRRTSATRDLFRRARRTHERKLARGVDDVVDGRRQRTAPPACAPAPRSSSTPASRRSPTRPPPPSWARRSPSSPARERRAARASRWSPTASAAMHGVTHTLQELRRPRRAGLRGRGRLHRPDRRPPPRRGRRGRDPVLRGAARSACRRCPRSSRRSPRAATTSSTSARPARPASPRC